MEQNRDEPLQGRGLMPVPRLEPLPLRLVELPERQLDYLTTVLERWCEEHGLVSTSAIKAVRVFTQHCSPADACDVGIALTGEYQMLFFAINDMPDGAEKGAVLAEMRLALHGHLTGDKGLPKATSALRSRVLETFGEVETARLFGLLDRLLVAFLWEAGRADDTPPVALYRENRQHTIAAHPYVELFRLAERVKPLPDVWPALTALEKLCVEIIYLTNDILSVKRDLRKKKHNIVIGLARDSEISYEAALSQVIDLLKRTVDEFLAAQSELLRDEALDERTRKYVDHLGSILEGNRMATVILTERYVGNG
jgi:Terpene synthase family 2, C-terminal metal binding